MNYQKLIIYDYVYLFNILNELKDELNLQIFNISKNDLTNPLLKDNENNIIITKKKIIEIDNKIIINDLPVTLIKLLEKFNIEFIKKKI